MISETAGLFLCKYFTEFFFPALIAISIAIAIVIAIAIAIANSILGCEVNEPRMINVYKPITFTLKGAGARHGLWFGVVRWDLHKIYT